VRVTPCGRGRSTDRSACSTTRRGGPCWPTAASPSWISGSSPGLSHYPGIHLVLLQRMDQRAPLATAKTIAELNRVDRWVLNMLWHLAERWGRVSADCVLIPLNISHRLLGEAPPAHGGTGDTVLWRRQLLVEHRSGRRRAANGDEIEDRLRRLRREADALPADLGLADELVGAASRRRLRLGGRRAGRCVVARWVQDEDLGHQPVGLGVDPADEGTDLAADDLLDRLATSRTAAY
jgi:hypothetical protein